MESDNARSVSYSSDKFPPPSLVQARLTHTDKIPFSPFMMTSNSGPAVFDLPPPPAAAGHQPQQPPRSPLSLPITTSSESGPARVKGGGNLKLGIPASHAK